MFLVYRQRKKSIHEIIADIDYAAQDESLRHAPEDISTSSGRISPNAAIEELINALEIQNRQENYRLFPAGCTIGILHRTSLIK
jgi:hypothetical protein